MNIRDVVNVARTRFNSGLDMWDVSEVEDEEKEKKEQVFKCLPCASHCAK